MTCVVTVCSYHLSVRWKVLLSFNCRNRLLLTGTPIQNTMQEVATYTHYTHHTHYTHYTHYAHLFHLPYMYYMLYPLPATCMYTSYFTFTCTFAIIMNLEFRLSLNIFPVLTSLHCPALGIASLHHAHDV